MFNDEVTEYGYKLSVTSTGNLSCTLKFTLD